MKVSDFDYDLPEELIAQQPVEPRDSSRLLVLDRRSGRTEHRIFRDLPEYLDPGDLLVANRTRVIPARLFGRKRPTGGRVEVLLLRRLDGGGDREGTAGGESGGGDRWEALVRPGRRLRPGHTIAFDGTLLAATVREQGAEGTRVLEFAGTPAQVDRAIREAGRVPLPPYIHREVADPERYQTVYGDREGSAAAPTAGLHFTPALLDTVKQAGVGLGYLTLHVGIGTFRPVSVENVEDHVIHHEWYSVPPDLVKKVEGVRTAGRRVVAVGTTSVRTLETVASGDGHGWIKAGSGESGLFIYPGFRFQVVDAMVTNFHLPRSSLLMLVSAFAGREMIFEAYREAIGLGYRFFSFGDAMLIL